jgi:3-oxoacyl-[acyl-carrier protein] reductase
MFIVTGSSKGIGNAIARRLLKNGHDVCGISRSLPEDNSLFKTYLADVANKQSLMEVANILKSEKVTVDGLINCAGVMQKPFVDWSRIQEEDIQSIFSTNVIGTINSCQSFIPLMNIRKHTPIINISSLSAHANTELSIYGSSKHAVKGFTSSLAKILQATSIRPNCIAPGPIKTEMTSMLSDDMLRMFASPQIINSKVFTSDDICDIVELLIDHRSSSLTGQTFHVGGY